MVNTDKSRNAPVFCLAISSQQSAISSLLPRCRANPSCVYSNGNLKPTPYNRAEAPTVHCLLFTAHHINNQ